jgi:hypothetical protein
VYKLTVSLAEYLAWCEGKLIQKAMPELTKDERELLISGTCGPCFDRLFRYQDDIPTVELKP